MYDTITIIIKIVIFRTLLTSLCVNVAALAEIFAILCTVLIIIHVYFYKTSICSRWYIVLCYFGIVYVTCCISICSCISSCIGCIGGVILYSRWYIDTGCIYIKITLGIVDIKTIIRRTDTSSIIITCIGLSIWNIVIISNPMFPYNKLLDSSHNRDRISSSCSRYSLEYYTIEYTILCNDCIIGDYYRIFGYLQIRDQVTTVDGKTVHK